MYLIIFIIILIFKRTSLRRAHQAIEHALNLGEEGISFLENSIIIQSFTGNHEGFILLTLIYY